MASISHPILSMTLQRIALGLLSLVIVSAAIFTAVSFLPGDFATAILGRSATPDAVAAFQLQLGLDKPWPVRYLHWLGGALVGDFGNSFSSRPVSTVIGPRLLNTLKLATTTAAIAVPLAVFLGMICARYRNKPIDRFLSAVTLASISLPEFFVAYVLMLFLATKLHIFPSLSSIRVGMDFAEQLHRMALPAITMTLVIIAHMMRMTRAAIINLLASPYIEMAQLKGVSRSNVIRHHALPNAWAPIATVVAFNLAYLVVGVVVVEVVFVYPGIGQLMVDAVSSRDMPVVQACALIFAATYILLNLLADIVSIVTNPRLLHPK